VKIVSYLRLLIICCFFKFGFSQNLNTDSLFRVLKNCKNDTNKARCLEQLAWEISYINLDSSLVIGKQSLDLAKELNYERGLSDIYNTLGNIYSDQGNYTDALKSLQLGLEVAEKYHQYDMAGDIYNTLGILFHRKHEFQNSVNYYYNSLKYYSLGKSPINKINREYSNIAAVYIDFEKNDSALFYLEKAIHHNLKTKNYYLLTYNYINASDLYEKLNRKDEAYKVAELALNYAKESKDNYVLSVAYITFGKQQQLKGSFVQAANSFLQSLEMSKTSGELEISKAACRHLSDLYFNLKDFEKAHFYLQEYNVFKDSLFNIESDKTHKELETKYQTEKKQKEIENLIEKDKNHQLEAEKNKLLLLLSLFGAMALITIVFVLYRQNKIKQKAHQKLELKNTEIENQKNLVEEKNKEITDSINYAKRIQHSLLTNQQYFKKHTSDFFILFKPKDIVSGDFYWALNHKDRFLVMTADCTGHGVPGAMMSMMGINFLNEIVSERGVNNPAEILNHLRTDIIKALNPEGSLIETKDGMDCSLCSFDFKEMKLHYACANNSFYILRNKEIIFSKANKMPVGAGHNFQIPFDEYVMDIEKNDLIITFTDGYADQFGGEKGKKFKYKQLEKLLFDNAHLPLNEIKLKLDAEIENWKGKLEQVDDICVIGVKI